MRKVEGEIFDLMGSQHGLVSLDQARERGLPRPTVQRRVEEGQWIRQDVGVFRHRSSPNTWHSQLLGACLRSGGVAGHQAAAWLWRLDGVRRPRPSIIVPVGRWFHNPVVTVRESTQFDRVQSTQREGVPATDIGRTLVDYAGDSTWERFEAAIDDALRRELTTWEALLDSYRLLGRRGRNGSAHLRRLLDERFGDDNVPLSTFSRMVTKLLVNSGLPEPVFEYPIPVPVSNGVAHVDLAYPDHRLVVELQSVKHHVGRAPFERDARRAAGLVAVGWRWVPVTFDMYRREPKLVVKLIRSALNSEIPAVALGE